MHDDANAQAADAPYSREKGPKVVVAVFAAVVVVGLTVAWNAVSYRLHGGLNPYYVLLSLFLSLNLLICYWEVCLYLRRFDIEDRARYWRERRAATGRSPGVEFLTARIPLRRIGSPTIWADVWATYALYDGSYADRSTFGFNCDVGNGFVTPIPSLVLLAALTFGFMPAVFAGVLGVGLFWQWVYVSSLYAVSFWMAERHEAMPRTTRWLYVWGPNAAWIVVPLLGLFVSTRLILDGTYAIVGH